MKKYYSTRTYKTRQSMLRILSPFEPYFLVRVRKLANGKYKAFLYEPECTKLVGDSRILYPEYSE